MSDAKQAIKALREILPHGEPYDYAASLAIEVITNLGKENAKLHWLEAQFEAIQRDKTMADVPRGT